MTAYAAGYSAGVPILGIVYKGCRRRARHSPEAPAPERGGAKGRCDSPCIKDAANTAGSGGEIPNRALAAAYTYMLSIRGFAACFMVAAADVTHDIGQLIWMNPSLPAKQQARRGQIRNADAPAVCTGSEMARYRLSPKRGTKIKSRITISNSRFSGCFFAFQR